MGTEHFPSSYMLGWSYTDDFTIAFFFHENIYKFHENIYKRHYQFIFHFLMQGRPQPTFTAWKMSVFRVFSGSHFPAFGLNISRYGVSHRIQSEWGKIPTRKVWIQTLHAVIYLLKSAMVIPEQQGKSVQS